MANNKSAKKRIEINKRNRLRNKYYKTSVRTLIKLFFANLEIYKNSQTVEDKQKVQEILNSVYSLMDKGTKKMQQKTQSEQEEYDLNSKELNEEDNRDRNDDWNAEHNRSGRNK